MNATSGGSRQIRPERGSAAVEFALLLPVLMALVFGIVDYGLWLNSSLSVRQGVAEAARMGVVRHQLSTCPGTGMDGVACTVRKQMLSTGGTPYAKVFARSTWTRGTELVVCGMVQTTSFSGFVPLPSSGLIKSKTIMSIESISPAPTDVTYTDLPPVGGDWSWCS